MVSKLVISTAHAPEAVGPYSQAIVIGDFVFCSGQVGLDPDSGELVGTGVRDQTSRAIENLKAVLHEAGTDLTQVVKVTAYLTDMNDFGDFNEVYAGYFADRPPARATVGVASLPKGACVEIECIARV